MIALLFGIVATSVGIYTGTAHNVAFGLMSFALIGADYWDRNSEKEETK
jgi:hypothetical protein